MASRATNEAVEVFRKLRKAELTVERLEREVRRVVHRLTLEELDDYAEMTAAMDERVAEVSAEADARGWAESTRMQVERRALNGAGLDR